MTTTMKGLKNRVKREYRLFLREFTEPQGQRLKRLEHRAAAADRLLVLLRKRHDYIREPVVHVESIYLRERIDSMLGAKRPNEMRTLKVRRHTAGGN